jgi:hypothetical protein
VRSLAKLNAVNMRCDQPGEAWRDFLDATVDRAGRDSPHVVHSLIAEAAVSSTLASFARPMLRMIGDRVRN